MTSIEKLALQAMLSEVIETERKFFQLSSDVKEKQLPPGTMQKAIVDHCAGLNRIKQWIVALQDQK